jgi:hypothetical protein
VITIVGVSPLVIVNTKTVFAVNIFAAVAIVLLLFLLVYGNYKMFIIAKSKRENEGATPSAVVDKNGKHQILNLKNISTCYLVVWCFFICSCPHIIYSVFRLSTGAPPFDREVLLFRLWSNTFTSINSTLNCVIFFWRNSILRREGIEIIKSLRASREN